MNCSVCLEKNLLNVWLFIIFNAFMSWILNIIYKFASITSLTK